MFGTLMQTERSIRESQIRRLRWIAAIAGALLGAAVPFRAAPPVISSVSCASVYEGGACSVTGSNFGTKTTAAPVIWDRARGGSITTLWDGGYPCRGTSARPECDPAGVTTYNMAYRAVGFRSLVGQPHQFTTHYAAGAHGENNGPAGGYQVTLWKRRTINSYPADTYVRWWARTDPFWSETPPGATNDQNIKRFAFNRGNDPFGTQDTWYFASVTPGPIPSDCPTGTGVGINDDSTGLPQQTINANNTTCAPTQQSASGTGACNAFGANESPHCGWELVEMEIRYSPTDGVGKVLVWINGVEKLRYTGSTDKWPNTNRTEALETYARNSGNPTNWRYLTDIYYDTSWQRVLICPGSSYASRGICEVQIPTSWSTSSVTFTGQRGSRSAGTSYMYVVNENGEVNSTGFAVTVSDVPVAKLRVSGRLSLTGSLVLR